MGSEIAASAGGPIRVAIIGVGTTAFKPRCVVLQGLAPEDVHPMVPRLAERDRITLLTTRAELDPLVASLRATEW